MFEYYKKNYKNEYTKKEPNKYSFGDISYYNEHYVSLYESCEKIISSHNTYNDIAKDAIDRIKHKLSSEYLSKSIELMMSSVEQNPATAIGKAKELIESYCKTILDNLQIEYDVHTDTSALSHKVLHCLKLTPESVDNHEKGAKIIRNILGNLQSICQKLAELRNLYGDGHGKSLSFVGLEKEHAKLAILSSVAYVQFVLDVYEAERVCKN